MRPRVELEGAIHHVFMRGDRKEDVFLDDRDRRFFLEELEITARRYRWICLAYCLMTNHWHLIIETPERTLGAGMRRFNRVYTQTFNQRYSKVGHVYQGIFGSRVATTQEYLDQLFRYVALNPVDAELCRAPEDWRWSSHRQLLAKSTGIGYDAARVETLVGDYASLFDPAHPLAAKYGAEDPGTWRPSLASILGAPPSAEALQTARDHGYKLRELASALGVSTTTVWRMLDSER
jgi:REP element-mobilizing transposase RayT